MFFTCINLIHMDEFENIQHLNITCSQLGATSMKDQLQLSSCGFQCSNKTNCLAFSWIDNFDCTLCIAQNTYMWSTQTKSQSDDKTTVHYLKTHSVVLRG